MAQRAVSLTGRSTLGRALGVRYGFSVYDAMIVAAALLNGCNTTLLSEDMQHGLLVENHLQIDNPFRGT